MKNIKHILFGVAVLSILSSCQAIKDRLKVDIETEYTLDMPIQINDGPLKTSSTGFPFTASTTLDPTNSADLANYIDKIQGFVLSNYTVTVTQLSFGTPKSTMTSLNLIDAELNLTDGTTSVSWTFPGTTTVSVGSTFTLTDITAAYTAIATMMNTLNPITLTFSGISSQNNVNFTISHNFGVIVTAGI